MARSTFPSQNVQNTPGCPKNARRCGAKHIFKSKRAKHTRFGALLEVEMSKKMHAVVAQSTFSKSKCTKHTSFGAFLEVEMSKKCMPLWRENISKSKVLKTDGLGPLLEVDTSFCVAGARDSACCHK